jgi:hypothetical protein
MARHLAIPVMLLNMHLIRPALYHPIKVQLTSLDESQRMS